VVLVGGEDVSYSEFMKHCLPSMKDRLLPISAAKEDPAQARIPVSVQAQEGSDLPKYPDE